MTDTDPQTAAIYRELLMQRKPGERFLMGVRMCESARLTVLASLPAGQSAAERKIALLHRYYRDDFSAAEMTRIEEGLRSISRGPATITPTS